MHSTKATLHCVVPHVCKRHSIFIPGQLYSPLDRAVNLKYNLFRNFIKKNHNDILFCTYSVISEIASVSPLSMQRLTASARPCTDNTLSCLAAWPSVKYFSTTVSALLSHSSPASPQIHITHQQCQNNTIQTRNKAWHHKSTFPSLSCLAIPLLRINK